MKKIPKPTMKAKEVFLECISTVKNVQLKQDYADCQNIIESAENDFETKFPSYEIYLIPQILDISKSIDKVKMEKVYTYRMVKSGMPGNPFYNKIKAAAPYGKCPLCSVRSVDTLDHYLPKAKYPTFSVVPINLIPSCTPCNIGKKVAFPTNEIEQTLHPYYDNIQDESWIKATVLKTNPISFDYYVDCPTHWKQIQKDRAENHFNAFNLNELFSSKADEALRGAKQMLQKLFNQDPDLLMEHLRDSYLSKRDGLGVNSWQATMYFSLMNDKWFLQEGVLYF